MARRLLVRQDAQSPWVDNFAKGGWHVYVGKPDPDSKCPVGANCEWVRMLPSNTKFRSADNKSWECVK